MQQSSDGNYDFGVDAFHLVEGSEGRPSDLVLVQAKYSESLQQIAKGFRDLEGALVEVARRLQPSAARGTARPGQYHSPLSAGGSATGLDRLRFGPVGAMDAPGLLKRRELDQFD